MNRFKAFFISGEGEYNGPVEDCGWFDTPVEARDHILQMLKELGGFGWIEDSTGYVLSEWGAA